MDFVRSHFGKMKLWPVAPFFHFFITFGWVCCCTQPKVIKEMKKRGNWSEFHFSEVTSYKIHTLTPSIKFKQKFTRLSSTGWNRFDFKSKFEFITPCQLVFRQIIFLSLWYHTFLKIWVVSFIRSVHKMGT